MIDVYADESCKENHRHLILGGIAIETAVVPHIAAALKEVRIQHNTYGEVKWTKVSRSKLDFYRCFVDVFFDFCKKGEAHFHCLTVDTRTFNHHAHNGGSSEIGFNKLIYQLLLHKFGTRYGRTYRMYVYLDDRTTSQSPDALRPMLNSALKNKGILGDPFRRITFRDSKTSDVIQLNDILLGAIGFRKNEHHLAPNCSAHKLSLMNHVVSEGLLIEHPRKLSSREAEKFSVWNFEFKKKRVLAA